MLRALLACSALVSLSALARSDVSSYCPAAPNSVGPGAVIVWQGPHTLAQGSLAVSGLPRHAFGLFVYGQLQQATPFGDGLSCIGGANWVLARKRAAVDGTVALDIAREGEPEDVKWMQTSETWFLQYLYRDPAAMGSGFNLSNGLRVTFD